MHHAQLTRGFPLSAGLLLGLGLGGFFDGIVLHQLLQWHHLVTSAGYPPDSVENLKLNTFWDGVFHSATYVLVLLGLAVLWRASRRQPLAWSGRRLIGSMLMGFGIFNLVEGVIDHQILGLHHVRDDLGGPIGWDLGFLAFGALILLGGLALERSARPAD